MLVPKVLALTRAANIAGQSAALVPMCGVPMNTIPLVCSRMFECISNRSCALISAYVLLDANRPKNSSQLLACFTTIPPRLWHMNTIGRVFSYQGVSLLWAYRVQFCNILVEYAAFP